MARNQIRLMAAAAALAVAGVPALTPPSHAADVSISPAAKPTSPTPPVAAGPKPDASAETPYRKVLDVFTGDTTIAGEKVAFPVNDPGVKSLIVTMAPGEKTAWHRHGTPLYAYILEGELTVTYEGIGERHYKPGDGFLEAMHVTHQGHNTGTGPVRILAVFLTGDGNEPTIPEKAPNGSQ